MYFFLCLRFFIFIEKQKKLGVAHRVAHRVAHKVAHRVAHGLAHGPGPGFVHTPLRTRYTCTRRFDFRLLAIL